MKVLLYFNSFSLYLLKVISSIQYFVLNILWFPSFSCWQSTVLCLSSFHFPSFILYFIFVRKRTEIHLGFFNPNWFFSQSWIVSELVRGQAKRFWMHADGILIGRRLLRGLFESNRIGITKTFACWILNVPASWAVS